MHPSFKSNIINLYGNQGTIWLTQLPLITKKMAAHWKLSDLTPVSNLTYNYVLSGFQGSQPIILKLAFKADDLKKEAMALSAFAGFGVIEILEQTDNALLLERAIPGTPLKSYFPSKDKEAIEIACKVIQRLHEAPLPPVQSNFPHIQDWLTILDQNWDGIPNHYLNKARLLKNKLLKESNSSVLLHGDLHYDNILKNAEDWLVIDPKGVIGDPIYEVGCLIREPLAELLKQSDQNTILNHRIHIICDHFKLDKTKIIEWTFVQCVMACCWFLEDNQSPKDALQFISILDNI